jgi:hypothetical protein
MSHDLCQFYGNFRLRSGARLGRRRCIRDFPRRRRASSQPGLIRGRDDVTACVPPCPGRSPSPDRSDGWSGPPPPLRRGPDLATDRIFLPPSDGARDAAAACAEAVRTRLSDMANLRFGKMTCSLNQLTGCDKITPEILWQSACRRDSVSWLWSQAPQGAANGCKERQAPSAARTRRPSKNRVKNAGLRRRIWGVRRVPITVGPRGSGERASGHKLFLGELR